MKVTHITKITNTMKTTKTTTIIQILTDWENSINAELKTNTDTETITNLTVQKDTIHEIKNLLTETINNDKNIFSQDFNEYMKQKIKQDNELADIESNDEEIDATIEYLQNIIQNYLTG